jgi:hypothetical protein
VLKQLFVIIIVAVLSLGTFFWYLSQNPTSDPSKIQISTIKEMQKEGKSINAICYAIGGTWISEENQCANYPNQHIDEICNVLGGTIKTYSGGNLPVEIRRCQINP